MPEVRYHTPRTPIILVGLESKKPLNKSVAADESNKLLQVQKCFTSGSYFISTSEAIEFAKQTHCVTYIEANPFTGHNVEKVIDMAIIVTFNASALNSGAISNSNTKKECLLQ